MDLSQTKPKGERSRRIRTRIVAFALTAGILLILVMLVILLTGEDPPSVGSMTSVLLLLGAWSVVAVSLWRAQTWSPCIATLLCAITVVVGMTRQSEVLTWSNLLLQDLSIVAFPIGLLALGACLWNRRACRRIKTSNR